MNLRSFRIRFLIKGSDSGIQVKTMEGENEKKAVDSLRTWCYTDVGLVVIDVQETNALSKKPKL